MIESCILTSDATLLEALKTINDSAISLALVCEQEVVRGVVTDGDLRRAIIDGAELSASIDPYYSRCFVSVTPETSRADVLELMQARFIEQIPIIDEYGKLAGIHTMHTILGGKIKPNWAVIMAGGKGTRLRKLTTNIPKPMLKVAGRPILERLVLHVVSYGIRDIFLSVNYLSHVIEDYFGDGSKWGCRIHYLREDVPLGSGGALSLLPEVSEHPVLVLNGDLIFEGSISQILHYHEIGGYHATMGVSLYSHEVPFGCVVTEAGHITQMEEKPFLSKTINGGVYVFSPAAVKEVPSNTFFPITRIFDEALEANRPCGAYPLDGDWMDVGMPEQLDKARGL